MSANNTLDLECSEWLHVSDDLPSNVNMSFGSVLIVLYTISTVVGGNKKVNTSGSIYTFPNNLFRWAYGKAGNGMKLETETSLVQ